MAWTCTAAGGNESQVVIDDVTQEGRIMMNHVMYRVILSDHIQPNSVKVIGWGFRVQMNNGPTQIAKANESCSQDIKKMG